MKKMICNDSFLVGSMYAPFCRTEYVDTSMWEQDIKNMSELGIKCLHGFAEWWRVEKKKGVFDFSETDYLIELCVKYGITPIINVATQFSVGFYMPAWMQCEYKGDGMVDNMGGKGNAIDKQFKESCLDDPWYQMYADRYLKALATHYAGDDRIGGWVIWGEPTMVKGFNPICYCEHTVAKFKTWLKDKYGDIELLNKAWGTEGPSDFADFYQVRPPINQMSRNGGYASWLDWRNFMEQNFASHIKRADTIFKENGATQPTVVEIMSYLPSFQHGQSTNIWTFADVADIIGVSNFESPNKNTEMIMNIASSMAHWKNKSVFVIEACGGPRYPTFDKRTPNANELKAEAVQMLGANAKGLMFWTWRPRLSDFESGTYGMCRQDGKPLDRAIEAGKLADDYKKLTSLFKASPKTDVAIYNSYDIVRLTDGDQLTAPYNGAVRGACRLLSDLHISYGIVNEGMVKEGYLKDYKVLIMPHTHLLCEEVAKKVEEFVANGGIVIADQYFGFKNKVGRCFLSQPGAGFDKVFGAERDDFLYMNHPKRVPQNDFGIDVEQVLDIMAPTTAEILCEGGNTPLITKNAYGKGEAIYLAWQAFYNYYKEIGTVKVRETILEFLNSAGISPFAYVESEKGLSRPDLCVNVLYNGDEKLYTIVNPGYDDRCEVIELPDAKEAVCIYGTAPESIVKGDGKITLTLNLSEFGTSVLSVK